MIIGITWFEPIILTRILFSLAVATPLWLRQRHNLC